MKTRLVLIKYAVSEFDDDSFFKNTKPMNKDLSFFKEINFSFESIDLEIDLLYCGTDVLSVETAKKISKQKKIPLTVSEYLDDLKIEEWEGQKWENIAREYPKQYELWRNSPYKLNIKNAESISEFKDRLIMKLRDLVNRNDGKNICFVTGDYPLNLLFSYFEKTDYTKLSFDRKFKGGSVYFVDIENGDFNIKKER